MAKCFCLTKAQKRNGAGKGRRTLGPYVENFRRSRGYLREGGKRRKQALGSAKLEQVKGSNQPLATTETSRWGSSCSNRGGNTKRQAWQAAEQQPGGWQAGKRRGRMRGKLPRGWIEGRTSRGVVSVGGGDQEDQARPGWPPWREMIRPTVKPPPILCSPNDPDHSPEESNLPGRMTGLARPNSFWELECEPGNEINIISVFRASAASSVDHMTVVHPPAAPSCTATGICVPYVSAVRPSLRFGLDCRV